MDLLEAMAARHSVRAYEDRPIEGGVQEALIACIQECNRAGGLHMQLIQNEPKAFGSLLAHYGTFSGVKNYIALVGQKGQDLDERCGYYGEQVVLRAQQLGLNTCWVALTYRKVPGVVQISPGEKLVLVISVGYGRNQGTAHRSKTAAQISRTEGAAPEWFHRGVEAALLAPTALNQQKFTFVWSADKVAARAGMAFYSKVDLGIAKYHFELGAGKAEIRWE